MKEMLCSIGKVIGGCMILTAVLVDRTFPMQTPETFEAPFTAKTGAFEALEKAIDIGSLEFLLSFSSVSGLLGNAGQTNYSRRVTYSFLTVFLCPKFLYLTFSANTALTGLTRKYLNAATIVPPMITDTGFFLTMAASNPQLYSRYRHLSSWAMVCEGTLQSLNCERQSLYLLQNSAHALKTFC